MYIYKNETGHPVNICGFQFAAGQTLKSNIVLERFKEAVSSKILSIWNPDGQVSTAPVKESAGIDTAKPEAATFRKSKKERHVETPSDVADAPSDTAASPAAVEDTPESEKSNV